MRSQKHISVPNVLEGYLCLALLAACGVANVTAAWCADWPQLLGPNRNGVYPADDLPAALPSSGLPVVWQKEVGPGFAGPVVANGRLILFHRQGDTEIVEALDAATGNPIWAFDYPTNYHDDFGFDEGPRATPVVVGGQIYTFGAEGTLHCLQFTSGRKIWSADTHKQFGVRKGFFGAAGTPLVDGARLFVNVGGESGAGVVAFDKDNGRVLWKATDDEASYSSPVAATFAGERHILAFTRAGLTGLNPATGEIYFAFPWRARSRASVNAATPLVINDLIFLSASYETGAVLLRVRGRSLEKVWSGDDSLSNHYATSVQHDGYLYGYHGRQEYSQSLRCVEVQTGKVRWSEESFGAGTVTLAGENLLLLRENGELLMAAATPGGFRPLGRARVLSGTVRAYPAISDGKLYARNENRLICVRLK